jgi:hypothetical protein
LRAVWFACVLVLVVMTARNAVSQGSSAQPARANTTALERMPHDLEVQFALSALPPHLRDHASVYLLDPGKGYLVDRTGTNGFSCLVERTEWARIDFRNDIYTALCYDAEGSTNHLRVYMDAATLRARGLGAKAVRDEIAKRFASHSYVAPKRAGLSYMLAPLVRTYPNPDVKDKTVMTFSMPHHMIYAPNVTDRDIGGAPPPSPHPFVFEPGPQGYMILMLGAQETAKVVEDSKDLLKALCTYREVLCLPNDQRHP